MEKQHIKSPAAEADVRRIIMSAPKTKWRHPKQHMSGLQCQIEAWIDINWLAEQVRRPTLKNAGREHRSVIDVLIAGEYRRVKAGETIILSHPKHGECYLDTNTCTYLQFDHSQLPTPDFANLQKVSFDCTIRNGKTEDDKVITTFQIRGPVRIDWVVTIDPSPDLLPYASSVLRVLTSDNEILTKAGISVEEVAKQGLPVRAEVWLVDPKGNRTKRVAMRRVTDPRLLQVGSDEFAIPSNYRNMRSQPVEDGDPQTEYQVHIPQPKPRARSARRPAWAVPAPTRQSDIELPQCLPSSFDAISASETRQLLYADVRHLINMMSSRLGRFQVRRRDEEATQIPVTINWLDQLQTFHESVPGGDGLFCLLRDPPPQTDPLGGRTALLDRLAAGMAERMLGAADQFALDDVDPPLQLDPAVRAEIRSLLEDESIREEDRWMRLSLSSQVALSDAVLFQRIGRVTEPIRADTGELVFPPDLDLLHVRLRMQSMTVDFRRQPILRVLDITAGNNGTRPGVNLELVIPQVSASFTMERWPGLGFWIAAGSVLVVGSVASPLVAGVLVASLMGLGPVGLLLLSNLIAPLAFASAVLLMAVVTFLLWDVARINVRIDNMVIATNLHPDEAGGAGLAPDVDELELGGEIIVSYSSQIPSGIHQVLGWITEAAINHFDLARGVIAGMVAEQLEEVAAIPHFRLPPPFQLRLADNSLALRHELLGFSTEGSSRQRISAVVATRALALPHPRGLYATQTDIDVVPRLRALMDEVTITEAPLIGYALSQNLLNAYAHAQWASGVYNIGLSEAVVNSVHTLVAGICADCNCSSGHRHARVWAAACPRLLVTPRAFWADERRPYLAAEFPDLRLCISCGEKGNRWTLEVQFSVQAEAHLGFGSLLSHSDTLSMFSRSGSFVRIYINSDRNHWTLSSIDTQGLAASGTIGSILDAMTDAERLQMLQGFQELISDAAFELLNQDRLATSQIGFAVEGILNRQIYDRILEATFIPHRTTVYATFSIHGPASIVLPRLDTTGEIVSPREDLDRLEDFHGSVGVVPVGELFLARADLNQATCDDIDLLPDWPIE